MPRNKIIAANWKMNLTVSQAERLLADILAGLPALGDTNVLIAAPFVYLPMLVERSAGTPIHPAAQNCHYESWGAFTGEVSVGMLDSIGVRWCITGHSERREMFYESPEVVRRKTDAILQGGMTPIFCCGEPLDVRDMGKHTTYVRDQLEASLFHLEAEDFGKVVIAYEPIWAIGTGRQATPQQAQEMHAFIRQQVYAMYGTSAGDALRILYGGSMKADNARELFAQPDVDGGLVGGASLQASSFLSIIQAACG